MRSGLLAFPLTMLVVNGCAGAEPAPPPASTGPNPSDVAIVRVIQVGGAHLDATAAGLFRGRAHLDAARLRAVAERRQLLAAAVLRGANSEGFQIARLMPGADGALEAGGAAGAAFAYFSLCARSASAFYSEGATGRLNKVARSRALAACRTAHERFVGALAKAEAVSLPTPSG